MKSIFIYLLIISSFTGLAQTGLYTPTGTVTSSTVTPSSGYVGVGTDDPSQYLHITNSFNGEVNLLLQNTYSPGTRTFLTSSPSKSSIQTDRDFSIQTNGGGWSDKFILLNNGYVGIGNTSPSEKLDVGGYDKVNIRVGRWATLGIIGSHLATVVGNNVKASSINNNMEILTTHSTDGAKAIKMQYNEGITFHTLSGSVTAGNAFSSERVRIDNSGNVGIGVSSPSGKLQVAGSTYIGNENADALYRVSLGGSGGNYGSIGYGYKYTLTSFVHNYAVADFASQMDFATGGFTFKTAPIGAVGSVVPFTSVLRIQQNGNIGIGTASPAAKLEVNGDANIGIDTGTITGYGARLSMLGASSNGDALWLSRYNNGTNQTELRVNIGDDPGQSQDMFVVGTHNWNGGDWYPHMAVQASGNVGIGTTTTDAKLTVKGNIHTNEVKVDLNGAVAPDYVFEKDYKLTSLEEIKTYIDQHKHLPEVPSAKEMETNGVNLGEMNMLLLKKIEELTLYVIRQSNENREQKEKIEILSREIMNLKSKK